MNVMVVGGAGYIGSHAVKMLFEAGHRVVAVDNLFRGHRHAVHPKVAFHQADLAETGQLAELLHALRGRVRDAFFGIGIRGRVGDRPPSLLR